MAELMNGWHCKRCIANTPSSASLVACTCTGHRHQQPSCVHVGDATVSSASARLGSWLQGRAY